MIRLKREKCLFNCRCAAYHHVYTRGVRTHSTFHFSWRAQPITENEKWAHTHKYIQHIGEGACLSVCLLHTCVSKIYSPFLRSASYENNRIQLFSSSRSVRGAGGGSCVFVNAVGRAAFRGCFEVCPAINSHVTGSCISLVFYTSYSNVKWLSESV